MTPTVLAERVSIDAKVKVGEEYISQRLSTSYIVEIVEVLPANKVKVQFRGLPEGFNEIKSKRDLLTIERVQADEELNEGDRLFADARTSGLEAVEVMGVLPNHKVMVHYVGYSSSWDKAISRNQLYWADGRPKKAKTSGSNEQETDEADAPKPARPEMRIWTDISGKFKIKAKFAGVSDGKVKLLKVDGKTIQLPLDKLSQGDRKHIDALASEAENPFATE